MQRKYSIISTIKDWLNSLSPESHAWFPPSFFLHFLDAENYVGTLFALTQKIGQETTS